MRPALRRGSSGSATWVVALYLIPFAGVAFLWFLATLRRRIGRGEDQFLATVFLGSGFLFIAMLFAADAAHCRRDRCPRQHRHRERPDVHPRTRWPRPSSTCSRSRWRPCSCSSRRTSAGGAASCRAGWSVSASSRPWSCFSASVSSSRWRCSPRCGSCWSRSTAPRPPRLMECRLTSPARPPADSRTADRPEP